jgi:hypothetical protein
MKASPSKSAKAVGKKRGREETAAAATEVAPPMSPPRADPSREWKKSKVKTEDLLALLNNGFIREKEVDMWRAAAGDPYPMEKAEDEIPMFARFVERGLVLPASDFFKGLLGYYGVEYLNLNPNGIFQYRGLRAFLRGFPWDQAALDPLPEVFPGEAAAKRHQPKSSRRGRHPVERRRRGAVPGVQAR